MKKKERDNDTLLTILWFGVPILLILLTIVLIIVDRKPC